MCAEGEIIIMLFECFPVLEIEIEIIIRLEIEVASLDHPKPS